MWINPTMRALLVGTFRFVPAVALVAGCGGRLQEVLLPEARPTIRLTRTAIAPPGPDRYAYLARWTGTDVRGPIHHYRYAIDPVSVDTVDPSWVQTTETERMLAFPTAGAGLRERRPHVFVIRAVNARGVMSDPVWFTFAENNLPPMVAITNPIPTAFPAVVTPDPRIDWTGSDPDGQTTTSPVRYTFRLFGQHNPDRPDIPDYIAYALLYPDSVRSYYAPGFPGWTSVSGETTWTRYSALNVGSTYLFAITAFDEAGDYDPVFTTFRNMLRMNVVPPGAAGPILTLFNEFFRYDYPTGGYSTDPSRIVPVEVAADVPVTLRWVAQAVPGSQIRSYRWVMDPEDLTDETPRSDEQTDWWHWSARSVATTTATVGPFAPLGPKREGHLLYVEAQDTNDLRSLGIVRLVVVRPTFTDRLLFVDDTRFLPDRRSGAGQPLLPPIGPWPTAAELDTFLFARGGYPWREYPEGTLSGPGIFNGYDYDTLGTRGLPQGVPFSVLASYRHVVWYTDPGGATFTQPPSDRAAPITALRLMTHPSRPNALAAYVRQGGNLWLCGGGAAYATLIAFNKPGTSPGQYDDREPNPELQPGRMMYDLAHWRAGIQILPASTARRFDTRAGGFGVGSNRPGRHWPPSPPPPTPSGPPNYSLLPADLNPKSAITDGEPPLHPGSYPIEYTAEHIFRETFIREDYNDDPDLVAEYSTLDTLYLTRGGSAPANAPVMTYYHGRENQHFVFSGFNFWYWRRTQCIELVDWVLQQVWGLQRDPTAARGSRAHPL